MIKVPRIVAVDLTPILPGGENGGAKIFVLDLLRQLADVVPETQFVLLTQAASHDELASLDRRNIRRKLVIGEPSTNPLRPRASQMVSRFGARVPARLRNLMGRVGRRLNLQIERRRTKSLLRDLGVDLLFCPFTAPTYFEPGIPTVCTIHDLQYKTYPEFFSPEDVAHRDRTFIDAARRATAIAAVSDYSRQSAITHGKLDPASIWTIHHRMARRISPEAGQDESVLQRLGLTPRRYLVYPANFWKHKNHEMLLTAFGVACRGGNLPADVKLVCTGAPGERRDWLMSAARTMGLADRIVFPGYLPNAELAALVSNCSGVVFPSLYEGFGLPVIEAMAAGVPVACSNTTSLPEVAADAAILFDPRIPDDIAKAMVTLVCDEARRQQLIQAGHRRGEEFSDSSRVAKEYWELFCAAVANFRHENLITGVTADGWVGDSLKIQTAPLAGGQAVEVQFCAPEWLPQRSITVRAYRAGKPEGTPINVQRGSEAVLSLPMDHSGGHYELQFTPTFIPARCGLGDDYRELSALLRRCSIIAENSDRIELYPESTAT